MHTLAKMIAGAGLVLGASTLAYAQGASTAQPTNTPHITISDPEGAPPDPGHIPFVLPKDIKWTGQEGRQQTAILYGNPDQPGPYGLLYRWYPGNFSRPHFHDQIRWIYVVSGTWWVSSSSTYDERTTYPFHAGTFSTDVPNTIHWDGCRTGEKEPAILLLTGIGPVKTIQVGTDGVPLPPRPAAGR